jgi:hypothetical protein
MHAALESALDVLSLITGERNVVRRSDAQLVSNMVMFSNSVLRQPGPGFFGDLSPSTV